MISSSYSRISQGAMMALALGGSAAIVLPSAKAGAQAVDAQRGGLEEILVTARKREEGVQDIPVSVTALSAEQIARYDLTSLEKVAASTPQLTVGRAVSGSGAQITLRGIGSNFTSIGIEQSVAVVVDGVYYGQGRIINEGFFDLDRLEVLKGPQALFFGKNATAGVISFTTAKPTDEFFASARVGYEFRAEEVLGEAVVSGPLSDKFGVRVAVRGTKMFGGLFENGASDVTYRTTDIATNAVTDHFSPAGDREMPGGRELLGRVTFEWTPSDRLTATLGVSGARNRINNPSWNYAPFACVGSQSTLNPAIPCEPQFKSYLNDFPEDIAASLPFADEDGGLYNLYRSAGVTGSLDYELDNVTLTAITNYNWNRNSWACDCDLQSVGPQGIFATEDSSWRAFSTELRALTSYDGPLNLMVGFYYQKTKRRYDAWTASGGLENSASPEPFQRYIANSKDSETDGETLAGFGQVIFTLSDQWELAGGVRYTHETKDSYFLQPYSHPTRVAQTVFLPGVTITADQTWDNWSPEATLTFKPVEDVTAYIAYKTAYKSGGFSNSGIYSPHATVDDFAFDPETAKGFEGGVKTTLFDRQLRLNLIGYSYKYSNLQVDFFNSPTFAFITTNAGSAKTEGVEVEFQWAPHKAPDFLLRGSVNYNKARYAEYLAPCYTGQTPAQGCSLTGPAPGFTPLQDLSGTPTAMAPLWTASLGASYDIPVANFILGLSADGRYSSSYLSSAFGHPASRQKRYISLDAAARLRTEDERWELALIGRNLTNRRIVTGGQDGPNTGSGTGTPDGVWADQIGLFSLPRTVQLQASWRY